MKKTTKRSKIIVSISFIVFAAALLFLVVTKPKPTGIYKVADQPVSAICTEDIGRSSCGDFRVLLVDTSGQQVEYFIKGWNESPKDQAKSEAIESVIDNAQKSGKKVHVTLDGKYITSAE